MHASRIVRVILVSSIALHGCGVASNVEPGYELAKSRTTGILAVGITFGPEVSIGSWMLRRIGSSEELGINFWTYQDPATWTDPKGRLAIVELEAGDWELYDWGIVGGLDPAEYFSIPFRISPGRVTYIGRLHLDVSKTKQSYFVTISDHFDEDYAALQHSLPRLEAADVSRQAVVMSRCRTPPCEKEETLAQKLEWIPIVIPVPLP